MGHFVKHSKETKKKISEALRGQKLSKETRQKISEALKGENGPNWRGGKSFEPYSPDFNNALKRRIRKRDYYRCQECFRHQDELYTKNGKKRKLYIHHIDYNKKNNDQKNLISLCMGCHQQTNFDREDWTNYFQGKINELNSTRIAA